MNGDNFAAEAQDALHLLVHTAVGNGDERSTDFTDCVGVDTGNGFIAESFDFVDKHAVIVGAGAGASRVEVKHNYRFLSGLLWQMTAVTVLVVP